MKKLLLIFCFIPGYIFAQSFKDLKQADDKKAKLHPLKIYFVANCISQSYWFSPPWKALKILPENGYSLGIGLKRNITANPKSLSIKLGAEYCDIIKALPAIDRGAGGPDHYFEHQRYIKPGAGVMMNRYVKKIVSLEADVNAGMFVPFGVSARPYSTIGAGLGVGVKWWLLHAGCEYGLQPFDMSYAFQRGTIHAATLTIGLIIYPGGI